MSVFPGREADQTVYLEALAKDPAAQCECEFPFSCQIAQSAGALLAAMSFRIMTISIHTF